MSLAPTLIPLEASPGFLERMLGWAIPASVAVAPFVVVYALARPDLGQGYFVQWAALLLLMLHGALLLFGLRRLPRRLNLAGGLLLANLLLLSISVLTSGTALHSLKKVMLPLAGVAICGMIILSPLRGIILRRVGRVLVVSSLILACYGIAQYFGFKLLAYSDEIQKNTVIATIGHPNYLASVLGPMVFVVIAVLLPRARGWRIVLVGAACTLILFCIYLARTRAVWLGLGVGFVTFAGMVLRHAWGRKHALRRIVVWMGIVVAGLLAAILLLLPATGRSVHLLERMTSSTEIKSRFFYWNTAIDMAFKAPMLGQGYARFDPNFWDYVLQQRQSEKAALYTDYMESIANRTPEHVHNEYLEVMCEQGLPGLAALLAALIFFVYFGGRAIGRERLPERQLSGWAILAALLCMLVDAFFSFPWRLPISLLVFAFILAMLYDTIYPQRAIATAPTPSTK